MADPFKRVNPGEPLVIQAASWNAMLDAERATATGAGPGLLTARNGVVVRVKNESGADLDRGSVLGLGDPIFTPADASEDAFLREVTFRGATPDITKHKRRFCVLLDPLRADVVGRAYVAGVCQVMVDVLHDHHEYATIADGESGHLASSRYGFAQILWRQGDEAYGYGSGYDTGVQWCLVRLGAHCPSVAIGKARGDIGIRTGAAFGVGQVDLYRSAGTAWEGPVETVDVLNASNTSMGSGHNGIDSGAWCSVAWDMDGTAWVSPLECQADAYS